MKHRLYCISRVSLASLLNMPLVIFKTRDNSDFLTYRSYCRYKEGFPVKIWLFSGSPLHGSSLVYCQLSQCLSNSGSVIGKSSVEIINSCDIDNHNKSDWCKLRKYGLSFRTLPETITQPLHCILPLKKLVQCVYFIIDSYFAMVSFSKITIICNFDAEI